MAGRKKSDPRDKAILDEFADFVSKGPRRVIDLPPWQTDHTLTHTYGRPQNVFALVMVPLEAQVYGQAGGDGSEVVISMSPPPQSWRELRAEQRAQFSIYGSDYMPYSRGWVK